MQDNNIAFWMNLVRDFFEPGALKRWCLSSYNTSPVGRHAQGLFPMVHMASFSPPYLRTIIKLSTVKITGLECFYISEDYCKVVRLMRVLIWCSSASSSPYFFGLMIPLPGRLGCCVDKSIIFDMNIL